MDHRPYPRPHMRRHPVLTLAFVAALLVGPAARAQDGGGQDGDAGDPAAEAPAKKKTPEELAHDQEMADRAAEDALKLIRNADIADVVAGLSHLAEIPSKVATAGTIEVVLGRIERHVAQHAGYALAQIDPEGALDILEQRLGDKNAPSGVQLALVHEMLAELPAPRAVELLADDRSLRSRNVLVRATAIEALGWHRAPEVVQSALDALASKDEDLRNVACVALGRVGDDRATMPLLGKLDMTDGGTAGFAAIALGRIEDRRIFPNVLKRLASGNRIGKGKALVASAREDHVGALTSLVKGGNAESKIAAAAALGKLGTHDPKAQEALLGSMLGDASQWVRVACFSALGRCADEHLIPYLDKRMGQKDSTKRMYVYELAGDLRAKGGLAGLQNVIWSEKNDVLRRVAQDAFWRIADPESMRAVEAKIRTARGRKAGRAAEILGMRRNMNGFELALEMLEHHKDGGREELWFEFGLEMQTGHFFGNDPAVWREWIEKNEKFFEREQAAIEREKWRKEFLETNTGPSVTPKTEQTLQRALDYLARHQRLGGAFDQQTFLDRCEEGRKHKCPISSGARVQMDPVGMSSLCSNAFFGAGCSPIKGRYRSVLARAVEYILSRQMPIGDYAHNDLIGGYNRPLALQAYGEAHAATKDPTFVPFIQRGVDFLTAIQADKAGWRYRVVDNANDSSVVSWVLFGAKSAEKSGARVRRSIYEGSELVLRRYQVFPLGHREDFLRDIDPNYEFDVGFGKKYYAETGYQDPKAAADQATTALGLMSRILLGFRRSHPFCIGSANKLLVDYMPVEPDGGKWNKNSMQQEYPMYFLYYGTLSMHQMGGTFFREWNRRVKQILPVLQETEGCSRGAFPAWSQDAFFSKLYTTAMGAMTLETYYRYAPILQD